MSGVLFILGAGASRDCGAPLMDDFLDMARDLLYARKVTESKEDFERVFGAISNLQQVHSKATFNLNNIESIFTALELGEVIQAFPGLKPEEIPGTIESLKKVIVTTLEKSILFKTGKFGTIRSSGTYEAFGKLLSALTRKNQPPLKPSVISFNYDLALDVAMCDADLPPNYALDGGEDGVELLKLHGSLNWGVKTDVTRKIVALDMRIVKSRSSSVYSDGAEMEVPIGSQIQQWLPNDNVGPTPVLVPPAWNKADYHRSLTAVWARAAKRLSEAEYIHIIGFSLPDTDSFFRNLYALGSAGTTQIRKICIYNPDPSVDAKFKDLLGQAALARYEFHPVKFADAVTMLNNSYAGKK